MFKIVKKSIISLLVFVMVLSIIPVSGFISAAATEIWNGSVASGYAGGSGTKASPYTISNGKQLAYLAKTVNSGTSYLGKYFKLTANIVLNDTANWSQWGSTVTPANVWTAIGNGSDYSFQGFFDGNGYTISGIYINNGNYYQGLFGRCRNAEIKNLGVINSYIKGDYYVGGMVAYSYCSTVKNCYNKGTVSETGYYVGGVVGVNDNSTMTNCYNTGTVTGANDYVGGLAGCSYCSTVKSCYNIGKVNGTGSYVGGLVGLNNNTSAVITCYNKGTIGGTDGVGGVVGVSYNNSAVTSCYSTGGVSGNDDVGGVVGYNYGSSVKSCYNIGSISGADGVGGVIGIEYNATVTNCNNTGTINGTVCIGGVIGGNENSNVTNCYNTGSVSGEDAIGGVIGGNESATVTCCYNTGAVGGTGSLVGGVAGYNSGTAVTNCYNTGIVIGKGSYTGGVVGINESSTVKSCYNTGIVSGTDGFGGVSGHNDENSSVTSCYYLNTSVSSPTNTYGTALTATQMKNQSYYNGFNFETVWKMSSAGYLYPQLRVHTFAKQVNAKYLKKAATCTTKAVYYKSCTECTLVSEETFESGGFVHKAVTDKAVAPTCTKAGKTAGSHCSLCNAVITAQKKVAATGHKAVTDKAVAPTCTKTGKTAGSHCSVCNAVIIAQKTVSANGHNYKTALTAATASKDGKKITKCSVCGAVKSATAIAKIKAVTLSKTSYTYTGKTIKPAVSVKDSNGMTIAAKYYTVAYKNNINPGKASVTVTFKGDYSGTKALSFDINPKGTSVGSIKSGDKCFTVYWSKNSIASGYEIQYSTSSSFSGARSVKVTGASTVSKKISGLSSGKKYYVRIRVYKTVSKTNYYSSWSAAKTVTVQQSKEIKIISKSNPAGTYKIDVEWTAVSSAAGYEIYCYSFSDNKWVKLMNTNTTTYSGVWTGWDCVMLKIRAVFVDNGAENATYGPWSETLTFNHK